jgi:hypothetical protein
MRLPSTSRRAVALMGVVALIGTTLIAFAGPASAAPPDVIPAQSTNLIDGQTVNVTVTTALATGAGVFIAVTQCGNATSAGVPLAVAGQNDCVGAEGLTTVDATPGTLHLIGFPSGGVAAGPHTVAMLLNRNNIGTNGAKCIAGGLIPCVIQAATATTAGASTGNPYDFSLAATITYKPPVSASITSITGQSGTGAARSLDVITVTGSNWDASLASVPVALCDITGTTCDAAAALTGTLSTDAGGALSGAVTVGITATTGARALRITNPDTQRVLIPIQILGARVVTLAPNAGGAGLVVAIGGSGFNSNTTVVVTALDSGFAPVAGTGAATVNATGAVTGTITINSPATAHVAVSEIPSVSYPAANPTTDNGIASFTFSSNSCTPAGQTPGQPTTGGPDANAATNNGCSLLQTVHLAVNGSVLAFDQVGNSITMAPITLNGQQQVTSGAINNVTVTDARGSLTGWTVIATMTDLSDLSGMPHHSIPAANMGWTPSCALQNATSGDLADVTTGAAAQLDNTTARTLCTAVPGGGGGTFVGSAPLSLTVPASVFATNYSATLTLTVT